ncbi:Fur family transcriptional regulator [soil metagenome]
MSCEHEHGLALQGDEAVAWALELCRQRGLRRTNALRQLLAVLVESPSPLTLQELVETDRLRDLCDRVTLYRLLDRLEKIGLVRRLGLHERAAHFTIALPGRHDDYLVCTGCGTIEKLDMECPVEILEKQVAKDSGFTDVHHELEFFGTCPECNA